MLTHLVMWKFKTDHLGKTPREHAQWMKDRLETLAPLLPGVVSLSVRLNEKDSPSAWDAALVSVFTDSLALENYKNDPRHREISAYCKSARTDRACVDFEN